MFHQTQNKRFWRRPSQPISWLSTEKVKQTQQSKHATIKNILQHKINQKNKSQVSSPPTTYSPETQRGHTTFEQ